MKLCEYWPEMLAELREFEQLAALLQPEFDAAVAAVRTLPENFFVHTLQAHAVQRWEQMLGLPVLDDQPLSKRRFLIASRFAEQRPFTITKLQQLLDGLCGAQQVNITVAPDTCTLTARVAMAAREWLGEVEKLLERVVPVNMQLDISLQYNEHGALAASTHGQLGQYTHKQLREEVF